MAAVVKDYKGHTLGGKRQTSNRGFTSAVKALNAVLNVSIVKNTLHEAGKKRPDTNELGKRN